MTEESTVGVVVIGRNEAARLPLCLNSLPAGARKIYVDSGSRDDSLAIAAAYDIPVISLTTDVPFSAARARNVGFSALCNRKVLPDFIQFVDGDCALDADWFEHAAKAMKADPHCGAVFGRLREKSPEASVYNRMCDDEWNVPIGPAISSGGVVYFRSAAFLAAGGFDQTILAGEEIDLCRRVAQQGWTIKRIDAEMGIHDADMRRFGQWWNRARRGGQAYTNHVLRNRSCSDRGWARQCASIFFLGLFLPGVVLACFGIALVIRMPLFLVFSGLAISLYPIQFVRIWQRKAEAGFDQLFSASYASLLIIGKFAQAVGMVQALWNYFSRRTSSIIEYRSS